MCIKNFIKHKLFAVDELYMLRKRIEVYVYVRMSRPLRVNVFRFQLQKLQKQFLHSTTDKLSNLLLRAQLYSFTSPTRDTLKNIAAARNPSQIIQKRLKRFQVLFGSKVVIFNDSVLTDIIFLDTAPLTHAVNKQTRFLQLVLLKYINETYMWDALEVMVHNLYRLP